MKNQEGVTPGTATRGFDRNFWWNISEGAFVTGGFALFSVQVFLAAFLTRLGAGPVWIGWLTTAWFIGFALPQPFSAAQARPLPFLKGYIMKWLVWQRVAVLGLAIGIVAIGPRHPRVLIALAFASVLVFTTTMGMANPVWLQWVGKVTPAALRGRMHALRALTGGAMGLVAAALAQACLTRWPFPQNFALVFGLSFLFLMGSYASYFGMVEAEASPVTKRPPWGEVWREVPRPIARDAAFGRFVGISFMVYLAILMPASYFVAFGMQAGVVRADQVAVVALAGGLAVIAWSPLVGWMADRYGNHRLLLLAAGCGVLSAGCGYFGDHGLPWLLAAVVWSGGAGVGVTIGVINLILEYAPRGEEAHFTSVANPLFALAGAVSPLVGGFVAEQWGYPVMMACACGLSVVATALVSLALFQPKKTLAPALVVEDK